MSVITEFDFKILDLIHDRLSCGFLDFIMPKITLLGNAGSIWIASAVMMLMIKRYRRNGAELAVSLIGCVVIGNILLKNIVARSRPCWINDTVNMLIAVPTDYSFPSGHTMSSFAAAAVIMHTDKRLGIAAYILASLIAFSRLYLYVHFPTDVIAGAVIGTAIGAAVCAASRRQFLSKGPLTNEK